MGRELELAPTRMDRESECFCLGVPPPTGELNAFGDRKKKIGKKSNL